MPYGKPKSENERIETHRAIYGELPQERKGLGKGYLKIPIEDELVNELEAIRTKYGILKDAWYYILRDIAEKKIRKEVL